MNTPRTAHATAADITTTPYWRDATAGVTTTYPRALERCVVAAVDDARASWPGGSEHAVTVRDHIHDLLHRDSPDTPTYADDIADTVPGMTVPRARAKQYTPLPAGLSDSDLMRWHASLTAALTRGE